jgi:hypothetical protein
MSTKTQVVCTDDLTGYLVEEGDGGTVAFSWQGVDYLIDLSNENIEEFQCAMDPFITSARLDAAPKTRRSRGVTEPKSTRTSAIRVWATDNGFQVNSKGRIAADIIAKYDASMEADG